MRGGDKLLEAVDGVPQLRRAVEAARLGGGRKVWVTVQPGDRDRRAVLLGTLAKPIEVPDWQEGMAASLRAGARAAGAQRAAALMVLLPDMPEIAPADIAQMIAAHAGEPGAVWRAAAEDGTPGHPVLIPARLYPALAELTGDAGARALLADEEVRLLPLEGQRATTDLDTPEAWADWRARTGHPG
jgi:CTP:molybdopterin cytidylyltransferase MocA